MNAVYLRPLFSCPSQTPHPSYAKNKGGGFGERAIRNAFCDRDDCGLMHPVVYLTITVTEPDGAEPAS